MPLIRPLEEEDYEVLAEVDAEYCRRTGAEAVVTAAALSFYARSGHSFSAERDGTVLGFVLAQAVWNGNRPTVRVTRLAGADEETSSGLLAAVTKSAYDAGVYDLVVELPERDRASALALRAAGWEEPPVRVFGRILGSRGAAGSGSG